MKSEKHLAEVFVLAGEVLVDGHGGGVEELDGGLLADAGQAEQLAPGTEPQAVYLRRQVQDSLVRLGLGRPAGKNENKIQQKSKIKHSLSECGFEIPKTYQAPAHIWGLPR